MNRNRSLALLSLLIIVLGGWLLLEGPDGPGENMKPATAEDSLSAPPPNELRAEFESRDARASVETHHPRAKLPVFEAATADQPSVVVRVLDARGRLLRSPVFRLRLESKTARGGVTASTKDGEAHFDGFAEGANVRVELSMKATRWKEASAEGVVPEETQLPLALTLATEYEGEIFHGRLVDERGLALAGHEAVLLCKSRHPELSRSAGLGELLTMDDGSFTLYRDLDFHGIQRLDDQDRHCFELSSSTADGLDLLGTSPDFPAEIPKEGFDLGDIVMRTAPIIAEGVVVDERGEPLAQAEVWAESLTKGRSRDESLHGLRSQRVRLPRLTHTDERGRFRITGSLPERDIRAVAHLDGYYAEKSEVHRAGSQQIEIVMQQAGELRGSILDYERSEKTWMATLTLAGEHDDWSLTSRHGSGQRWDPSGEGDVSSPLRRTGEFGWSCLPPGLYTVAIRGSIRAEPILIFEDIQVVAGQVARPSALASIDPRSTLHTLELTILDEQGLPVPRGSLSSSALPRRVEAFEAGTAKLGVSRLPVQLTISAPGFRTLAIEALSGDRVVELRAGLAIALELPGDVHPSEEWTMFASLSAQGGRLGRSMPLLPSRAAPEYPRFDECGKLRTTVPAPGTYDIGILMGSVPGSIRMIEHGGFGIAVKDTDELQVFQVKLEQRDVDRTAKQLDGGN